MYFMQAAGEPLKLHFTKSLYGPYAEELRHVLNAIEGHLVSGYADGGDAPDKQLELVPRALDDAQAFLENESETLARFERVSDLVVVLRNRCEVKRPSQGEPYGLSYPAL